MNTAVGVFGANYSTINNAQNKKQTCKLLVPSLYHIIFQTNVNMNCLKFLTYNFIKICGQHQANVSKINQQN